MTDATAWPPLTFTGNEDAIRTLHLWTQIAGKIRLAQTPWLNHSWHVPLYVTAQGLGTGLVPLDHRSIQLDFDFLRHRFRITTTAGEVREVELRPRTVADFYREVMAALKSLSIEVTLDELPSELPDPIRFSEDDIHGSYDPDYAASLWLALVQIDRVCSRFRTGFLGKASPIHFFWGSFDLAVTRFSGRRAPTHPGGVPFLADEVTREAYSHEVSSAGFWPGGGGVDEPTFYSYAYPTPAGFATAAVAPPEARFHSDLGEFVLSYEAVRSARDPDAALLAFLDSTYRAAADLGGWDRGEVECGLGEPGRPRTL